MRTTNISVRSINNEPDLSQISDLSIGEVIFSKDTGDLYLYTEHDGLIKYVNYDLDSSKIKYSPNSLFIHSYNRYNHGRNIQQDK